MDLDDVDAVDLMPLDTPILKVSRPVAACLRCRNAKIKCDGKLPACTSCERTGRAAECTSTNDEFARGKERSYVSTLETRIDRLQARLEDAQRRKPSVVSLQDDEAAPPTRRPARDDQEPPTPTTTKALRRKEASAIDDLVSDFGFLSVSATARDFYGFTATMSYARLIIWACSKDPLPDGIKKALPPRYAANQLIQHYLSHAFPLVPVFDEASFYPSIDRVYHLGHRAEPFDHWMVRMVLAVACVSLSQRSGDQSYLEGIGHLCAALDHSEAVIHPGAVSNVQALILLIEYAMLDPHHFDAWGLIGAASRAMADLGLHQDPPKGAQMSKGELELRRRVFWCVYVLDRSTSLVQTRAFSFSDDSTKVKVPFTKQSGSSTASSPLADGQDSPSPWLSSHDQGLDLIGLRQLQSEWYTDLFQSGRTKWDEPYNYIWNQCNAMKNWFEGISPSTSSSMRAYFELELLYSYVYVLAPSPRVPLVSPFAQTLIFEFCIRYADLMLHLLSDPNPTAPITFNDAMRVYMTGLQFLDVLQHNTDSLLDGIVPTRPNVRPSTAPPPPLPEVNCPPNESVSHFNTVRAITCIKRMSECLGRFGLRWGYLSWSQLYSTQTASMIEGLNHRQRDLETMADIRRPSMWLSSSQGSAGSVMSSGGSIYQHPSPNSSVSSQPIYQPSGPAPAIRSMAGFTDASRLAQTSPPMHRLSQLHREQGNFRGTFPAQTHQSMQMSQPPQQQGQRAFNYATDPQTLSVPLAPHQQFGTWTGYTGPSVPDTLDEENAVPPGVSWDQHG